MTRNERLEYHKMQAYWWTNAASNGHALTRQLFHGFLTIPDEDGKTAHDKPFTETEKVSDAMEIAHNHIKRYHDKPFIETEKVSDAMEIAQNHIKLYMEVAENWSSEG